jgi:hypothetical protein
MPRNYYEFGFGVAIKRLSVKRAATWGDGRDGTQSLDTMRQLTGSRQVMKRHRKMPGDQL